MNFIPLTEADEKEMLARIGVSNIEELLTAMKPKLGRALNLPPTLSELELAQHVEKLSEKNKLLKNFRGAGSYHHYIPSAINHMLLRGEFFTAYTPYQPEVSQGTLQAIYEFQTMICMITGMDVANASMYDCATAITEAFMLSRQVNEKSTIVIHGHINPQYLATIKTYAEAANFKITDKIGSDTTCVIVQNPDYHGNISDLTELAKQTHDAGALLIVAVSDPTCLALIKPPGEYNADIAVGELQSFGNGLNFGGPGGGFMAVKQDYMKRIPGRLCGMSVDTRGQRAFILTLQAREQHIKRNKAISNICTNQGLNSLAAVIYFALLGPKGLRQVASLSYKRAHELAEGLEGLGFKLESKTFYNEFVVSSSKDVENLNKKLLEKGMLGGVDLGQGKWLLCCTEMLDKKDIENFVEIVASLK